MPVGNIQGKERELIRDYGIGIRLYNSNPSGYTCNFWDDIPVQPLNKLEEEVAKYVAKGKKLKFGFFDVSKPGEPPFSEKSCVWYKIVVCNNLYDVEPKVKSFKSSVREIEKAYQEKLDEVTEKILGLPLVFTRKSTIESLIQK